MAVPVSPFYFFDLVQQWVYLGWATSMGWSDNIGLRRLGNIYSADSPCISFVPVLGAPNPLPRP